MFLLTKSCLLLASFSIPQAIAQLSAADVQYIYSPPAIPSVLGSGGNFLDPAKILCNSSSLPTDPKSTYGTSRYQCLKPAPKWPGEGDLNGLNIVIQFRTLDSTIPPNDLKFALSTNIGKIYKGTFGALDADVDPVFNFDSGNAVVHFQSYPCNGISAPYEIRQPNWAQLARGLEGLLDLVTGYVEKGGLIKNAVGTLYALETASAGGNDRLKDAKWVHLGLFKVIEKQLFKPEEDLFDLYGKKPVCKK